MSDLQPARGSPQIIENMAKVNIFDVEEQMCVLLYESWFEIDPGCVSIQFLEDFGIPIFPNKIVKF